MRNKPPSLVIVGGGVIGLSTAYYALKDGHRVTLLERQPQGSPNCSSGNAGMIVPSHFTPLAAPGVISKGLRWMLNPQSPLGLRPHWSPDLWRWLWLFYRHTTRSHSEAVRDTLCQLNLESRRLYEELAKSADFGLTTRGLMMLCQSQHTLEEEASAAMQAQALGLKVEVLDATGAAKLDPDIEMQIAGAIHYADDAHLDPGLLTAALRNRILEMGGTLHFATTIDHVEHTNGKVTAVSGPRGRFEADNFVIAGGAWSAALMRQIKLRLPLQAGKGYSLTLPTPPQLPRLCSILTEAKVAITPMGNSLRIAGTMEIGGLNESINRNRLRGIIRSVQRYLPRFDASDFDGIEAWTGLRPVSPDGVPYLGRVPHLDNLIVATGHAMMGLSLGPVSGKLVADLLAQRSVTPDIGRLDPARFK